MDRLDAVRGRVVVLGVGNSLRADDGAGPAVAAALAGDFPGLVFDGGQAPENLLGPIRRAAPDTLVLVDAADFGGPAGAVRVAAADEIGGMMVATHGAPMGMIMKALSEETGASALLVAVQVASTRLGEPMTEAVSEAVTLVAAELRTLLVRASAGDDRKASEPAT